MPFFGIGIVFLLLVLFILLALVSYIGPTGAKLVLILYNWYWRQSTLEKQSYLQKRGESNMCLLYNSLAGLMVLVLCFWYAYCIFVIGIGFVLLVLVKEKQSYVPAEERRVFCTIKY